MSEFGFMPDQADAILPLDEATLREWIEFSKLAWPDNPSVTSHLTELADRFGNLYTVEFSTVEFWKYLNSIAFGNEREEQKWKKWEGAT